LTQIRILILILELGNYLQEIPDIIVRDHYDHIFFKVREKAEENKLIGLLNWLEHKDRNPWVLQCLSLATTEMNYQDWRSTSFNTNNAESAHAQSQREGVKLTLISAVNKGMRLDSRHFEAARAMETVGIPVRYGNNSMTGRKQKSISRHKTTKRKEKANEDPIDGQELAIAQDLLRNGMSSELVEQYLTRKMAKN